MTKDQLALKISFAMHMPPHTRLDTFNEYFSIYKCLRDYFQYLSVDEKTGIVYQYDVEV